MPDQPPDQLSPADRLSPAPLEAPAGPGDPPAPVDGEPEEIDALPVLAGVRALEAGAPEPSVALSSRSSMPVQVAAVAATGFVAGAATLAVLHRRRTRRAVRDSPRGKARRGPEGLAVLGSRSFLVDVHLLGSRD
ncbi:MAG TPA: hypothetical protein VGY97_01065 [Solirubrobacteraceae bacterium]|nr:hypothetical protein [Solirubrobacteraceae bacterium]